MDTATITIITITIMLTYPDYFRGITENMSAPIGFVSCKTFPEASVDAVHEALDLLR